jgi:YVTN family beta-propeller protein
MIAISPDGKNLYITSRDDNKLLVVSAADLSVKAEVATDDEPHGVAYRK